MGYRNFLVLVALFWDLTVPALCQPESEQIVKRSIRGFSEEIGHFEGIDGSKEETNHDGNDHIVKAKDVSPGQQDSRELIHPRVLSFTLINANTNLPLPDLLIDRAVVNVARIGIALNIRANVAGGPDTVLFRLNRGQFEQFDDKPPFALYGDDQGDYYPGDLPVGVNTIEAIPYISSGSTVIAGTPLTVTFTVVSVALPAAPPPTISVTTPVPCDDQCNNLPEVASTGCSFAGNCVIHSCDANYGDCDESVRNGCETDLRVDQNCGACGNNCGDGRCLNGVCDSDIDLGCDPGSCNDGNTCGLTSEGFQCFCDEIVEGGGVCNAALFCETLPSCPNGTEDCPLGSLCVADTCCVENVCVSVEDFCGNFIASDVRTEVEGGTTVHSL